MRLSRAFVTLWTVATVATVSAFVLHLASYKTPERVDIVARTLLAMDPPPPSRIVSLSLAEAHEAPPTPAQAAARAATP